MTTIDGVWVFNGARSTFPSGVFVERTDAEAWIKKHKLSGTLTLYPLNTGVYEWKIATGSWKPTKEEHFSPQFIERFSSASQEHYHYEDGIRQGTEENTDQ